MSVKLLGTNASPLGRVGHNHVLGFRVAEGTTTHETSHDRSSAVRCLVGSRAFRYPKVQDMIVPYRTERTKVAPALMEDKSTPRA